MQWLLDVQRIFDLVPEAFAFALIVIGRIFLKLTQQPLLLFGKVFRHFDADTDILVAATATIYVLDALAFHAEYRAGLCTFRHFVFHTAVDCRHLQRVAQSGLRKRDRDVDIDILPFTGEDRVRPDGY